MGRKPNQRFVERPKTRKELRKDKRTQKKANRVHFHVRKKQLKIEYRERLKQQKKDKNQPKKKQTEDEDPVLDDDIYDQADMTDDEEDGQERGEYEYGGPDDDAGDEEIESDFELSDEELELKFKGRVKPKAPKPKKPEADRFQQDLQKEKQKQRQLEKQMRKQRVKQLIAANEDEDKVIRRLEKQLKIDKKRSEKHVPKMFNDGLEYALELCLPENIQKMYTAAKEAADNEADSDSGFQEDLDRAMGKKTKGKEVKKQRNEEEEVKGKKGKSGAGDERVVAKAALKMAKLREMESKYFDTDDELDSDLSGNDSEYERDEDEGSDNDAPLEVHKNGRSKKGKFAADEEDDESSEGDDFGLMDDEEDSEEDYSDEEDEDDEDESDQAPLEVSRKKPSGKKTLADLSEDDDLDEDDFGDSDSVSDSLPPKKTVKKDTPIKKPKPTTNSKKVERTLADLSEDDELDSDDFDDFGDSEDEAPAAKKQKKDTPTSKKQSPKNGKRVERTLADLSEDDELDEADFGDSEVEESAGGGSKAKGGIWEDIYGRSRDKDGNVIRDTPPTQSADGSAAPVKYVPPHMRARLEAAAAAGQSPTTAAADIDPKRREKLQRLRKQLKGYLNRLSEANMHRIVTDIESVYMQNSRHDVNHTLTQLIEEALIANVLAPERMVLEHMMLLAALHANIGSEVGAEFLQKFVERFDRMMGDIESYAVEDKRLDNVILVLCHMYTFKIFQHNLIYEILARLTANLTEKSVECVLLTLRSIGFALRKDDALALKELIATIQRKSNEASEEFKNESRLKYMLDVLLAIKNNNMNKIPSYDPKLAEHLRKVLRAMLVNGKYVTTLNITLDDLLRADQRGKWWVVGSAWTGNTADIGSATTGPSAKTSAAFAEATQFSATILELAKKQRMNTDDRKNVFCVLMSAEDYLDAFEKLHHLAIRDHKVIVTVIIHCCLSEKIFNPYYAVLTQKFCDFDRKYQLAVQFALWDRIKDLAAQTPVQTKNMAQFLIHLIEHGGLALSVLKVIEFGELDKVTLRLVRQIVLGLLMGQELVCRQVFERIAPSAKLKAFKDSLRLFMHHFLLKGGTKSGVTDDQMKLLRARIAIADKALETVDSRLQF